MRPHGRPADSFALRLAMMRTELGISLEEAAERCGLKPSTWATWEKGARPRGMDSVVQKIADGLGYDRGWIMFGGPLHDPSTDPDTPGGQGKPPTIRYTETPADNVVKLGTYSTAKAA